MFYEKVGGVYENTHFFSVDFGCSISLDVSA